VAIVSTDPFGYWYRYARSARYDIARSSCQSTKSRRSANSQASSIFTTVSKPLNGDRSIVGHPEFVGMQQNHY
jgi:hypothetical protein